MKLRIYVENDLVQCIETFMEVFNAEPWNDQWTFEKARQYLTDFSETPGFLGVLAMENKEVLGFLFGVHRAWWRGDEFYIHEMCVDPRHQNKGIGKALLDFLAESLGEEIENIALLTDRGIPAEAFYKRNGFEEIERLVFLSKSIERGE